MDIRKQTLATYNKSAQELSDYFQGIGSRIEDISRGLELAEVTNNKARIVELGCGDGRDAKEIVKHTSFFEGVDYSSELIKLAQKNVPNAAFKTQSMLDYEFPEKLDIIFAFASLLHLNRDEMSKIFSKAQMALKQGGIFYISVKYRPHYEEEVKQDKYGKRLFFFYNQELIKELAAPDFTSVYENQHVHGNTDWITIALKKNSQAY